MARLPYADALRQTDTNTQFTRALDLGDTRIRIHGRTGLSHNIYRLVCDSKNKTIGADEKP